MKFSMAICIFLYVVSSATGTVYHVSKTGSHSPPFDSQATGATNIQAAVDLAGNGDIVLIGDGHYPVSSEIYVANSILIASINGPDQVVIDGQGVCRGFYLENVACILSGVTITNGFSDGDGGGIYCEGSSPLITNSIVSGCTADYAGGVQAGIIHSSIISGNTSSDASGIADSVAYNCLIMNNSATNYGGAGALFSTLYNCTVVGNAAANNGGGTEACDVYNSIIYNNSAGISGDDMFDSGSVEYSCSSGVNHGVDGNITNSPSFIDLASGNFHLQPNSPCINAGNNSYVSTATDLIGNTRIIGVVDMGAYEDQSGAGDTDGDGQSDADEAIAGTDPNDDTSYFAITNWSVGSFTIEWPAFSGRVYRVFHADSLTNTFNQVGPVIHYPQNSYTESSLGESGFYKVEVQLQ